MADKKNDSQGSTDSSQPVPGRGRRDFLIRSSVAAGVLGVEPFALPAQAANPAERAAGHDHSHAFARAFQCGAEPTRRRKSFFDLTDAELRLLCRAIGYMRNGTKDQPLSVESPLQWDRWVAMHATHCTEASAGSMDQVHWSWFFLPWHRAYLWFLERHLANIVTNVLGEDGTAFALPYWDWISHKEMPNTRERASKGLASPLFGYDLTREDMVADDGLGFDNQALWDGYRKPSLQHPTMDPRNELTLDSKQHIEETILFMGRDYLGYMMDLDFESFAGAAVAPQSAIPTHDGMGVLEHYPHNNGHDWVGSRFGKNRNMGSLRYAASDPVFFMHHANIDRIWSMYPGAQPDPDAPWGPKQLVWGRQPYTFMDIDGTEVTVTVADVVKCMTNVTYVEPEPAGADFASFASKRLGRAPQAEVTLAQPRAVLGTGNLTVQVPARAEALKSFASDVSRAAAAPSLLVIETGPIAYTGKFMIRVFAGKPDADANTSIHDPGYVGRIRVLDSDGRANERDAGISHNFPLLIAPGAGIVSGLLKGNLPITLVALGPSPGDDAFRIQVRSISLKLFG